MAAGLPDPLRLPALACFSPSLLAGRLLGGDIAFALRQRFCFVLSLDDFVVGIDISSAATLARDGAIDDVRGSRAGRGRGDTVYGLLSLFFRRPDFFRSKETGTSSPRFSSSGPSVVR